VDDHYCLQRRGFVSRSVSPRDRRHVRPHRAAHCAGGADHLPPCPAHGGADHRQMRPVRLCRTLPDGRTVTVALAGAGTIFGEMDLLALRMRDSWTEVLEPGELCLMSRSDVQELLLSDPRIATTRDRTSQRPRGRARGPSHRSGRQDRRRTCGTRAADTRRQPSRACGSPLPRPTWPWRFRRLLDVEAIIFGGQERTRSHRDADGDGDEGFGEWAG
jgi:hypothetical protein